MSETKSECPNCNTKGVVTQVQGYGLNTTKIKMECPRCRRHWWTVSMPCTSCGDPTGFAVPGLCGSCYTTKRKGGE